jgi:hypothetical protein
MWTKSQKISGAVLGLAAVAFCVDRFVLGSGDKAAAAASDEYAVNRSSSSSSSSSSTTPATPAGPKKPASAAAVAAKGQPLTLASRLSAMAEARGFAYETVGDAFRPSEAWLAASRPPDAAKPAVAAGDNTPAAERVVPKVDYGSLFRTKHTLTAVMTRQRGGMAIVDGKTVRVGQTIDGFRLTHVGINEATFEGKETQVTLRLPEPTIADTR